MPSCPQGLDDLIDFPVSEGFMRFYAHIGLTPWWAWMEQPSSREEQRAKDWAEVVANSNPPTQAGTRGTEGQKYKGIKEAKTQQKPSTRPPRMSRPKIA